jgi:hypothetical protein
MSTRGPVRPMQWPWAMSPTGYARTAAGLFAAEAVFPIVHRLTGSWYNGFAHAHDVTIDTGLFLVWVSAALVGFLLKPRNGLAILLAGAAVSLMHGVMFSIATSDKGPVGAGVPFLLVGGVQLYLIAHAFPAFTEEGRAAREEEKLHRAHEPRVWHLGPLTWRPPFVGH